MSSPEMQKLAESIAATGEAIKIFREQYIPALKTNSSSGKLDLGSSASPSEHAELIQGIMDNMDQIRVLASTSERRTALPIKPECGTEFNVRGCAVLTELSTLPQSKLVSASRAKLDEVDTYLKEIEQTEKLIR